jgi:hypothetical protein
MDENYAVRLSGSDGTSFFLNEAWRSQPLSPCGSMSRMSEYKIDRVLLVHGHTSMMS